jgi:methionine synthase II (cobalamin-independent)
MSTTDTMPEKVHLVGSIALDSVEEVFRTTGQLFGRRLKRVPDGEPGGRRLWISWQYPLLRANGYLRPDTAPPRAGMFTQLRLAEGVKPDEIRFGELGYAREARVSYEDFLAARQRGEIAPTAKFQVCLPTPMAVIFPFCVASDAGAIEKPYEKAMLAEVAAICRAIPHKDLALQWDVCIEMVIWDGQIANRYPAEINSKPAMLERLKRLAASVPDDVELGFHLCYGDLDAKHFVEPIDAAKMVELANALKAEVAHPIGFLHMPVPIGRKDDAFYQPLRDLALDKATDLYLGVVHADGAEAIKERTAAASKYVQGFGIATECGIARLRTPDLVERLLALHAAASREPAR